MQQTLEPLRERVPPLKGAEVSVIEVAETHALLACTVGTGLKELVLIREPPTLHVYRLGFGVRGRVSPTPTPTPSPLSLSLALTCSVLEHGRQWFRSLEFTTDTAHCLADLPAEAVRLGTHPRPHWEAGDPAREQAPAASLVILRSLSKEEGAQIFIAARFLRGLLPEALLLQYNFWLRQDGAMTGQRRVERPQSAAGNTGTSGTDMGTGLGGEVDQADAELTAVEVAAAEAAQGESDELRVTLRNGTAVVRRVPIGVDGQPRPDEARRTLE